LPPTVAVFQILNDARKARQHLSISGAAIHSTGAFSALSCAMVQVAAISRPFALARNGSQPSAAVSISRVSRSCGSENSQVPPPSQASPSRQAGNSPRAFGRATVVIVFRSMQSPTKCFRSFPRKRESRAAIEESPGSPLSRGRAG
jgi:hypothetical protein